MTTTDLLRVAVSKIIISTMVANPGTAYLGWILTLCKELDVKNYGYQFPQYVQCIKNKV